MDYPDKFDEPGYCVLEEKLFDKDPDQLIEELIQYVKWAQRCARCGIGLPPQLEYGCTIILNLCLDEFHEDGVLRILTAMAEIEYESIDSLKQSMRLPHSITVVREDLALCCPGSTPGGAANVGMD